MRLGHSSLGTATVQSWIIVLLVLAILRTLATKVFGTNLIYYIAGTIALIYFIWHKCKSEIYSYNVDRSFKNVPVGHYNDTTATMNRIEKPRFIRSTRGQPTQHSMNSSIDKQESIQMQMSLVQTILFYMDKFKQRCCDLFGSLNLNCVETNTNKISKSQTNSNQAIGNQEPFNVQLTNDYTPVFRRAHKLRRKLAKQEKKDIKRPKQTTNETQLDAAMIEGTTAERSMAERTTMAGKYQRLANGLYAGRNSTQIARIRKHNENMIAKKGRDIFSSRSHIVSPTAGSESSHDLRSVSSPQSISEQEKHLPNDSVCISETHNIPETSMEHLQMHSREHSGHQNLRRRNVSAVAGYTLQSNNVVNNIESTVGKNVANTVTNNVTNIVTNNRGSTSLGHSQQRSIETLLSTNGLDEYLPILEAEALNDLNLLYDLVRSDASQFRATLTQAGITKLGHREKIVRLIEQLHNDT